jgi:glycerol-3-phosphate dehydrogenase (NAD(P)+)
MIKIAIIGAGELGQALGRILSRDDREILYWDRDEEKLSDLGLPLLSLPEVVTDSSFVLFCVPSWGVREALAILGPYLSPHIVAVFFSKGVDGLTGKLPIEMASKLLPKKIDLAVVSGAMVAEEIGVGHFGACLVASKNTLISEKVVELFEGTNILSLASSDVKGVAWAGVLKNVYALELGIAEGLGWTINERALLLGQSNEEILLLLKLLGGNRETWLKAPILADFVATSFDNNSLNHQVGLEIGRTGTTCEKSEGLVSFLPLLKRLKKKDLKDFPILHNLEGIIVGQEDPKKVFGKD